MACCFFVARPPKYRLIACSPSSAVMSLMTLVPACAARRPPTILRRAVGSKITASGFVSSYRAATVS